MAGATYGGMPPRIGKTTNGKGIIASEMRREPPKAAPKRKVTHKRRR